MKEKKILFFIFFFYIFCYTGFSTDATYLKEIKGSIEIKKPGGVWTAAEEGEIIENGTQISAGFNSGALLTTESSEVQIKALTRIIMEDYYINSSTAATLYYLQAGRVRCRLFKIEGIEHNFILSTPYSKILSDISEFEAETDSIKVYDGIVSYFNSSGQKVSLPGGVSSTVSVGGTKPPLSALNTIEDFPVSSSTAPEKDSGINTAPESAGTTGNLIVTITNM